MKKKILILGASGLLGLHLINYLKKYHKDFELNIFKRFNKYNFNNDKFCSRFLKIISSLKCTHQHLLEKYIMACILISFELTLYLLKNV